MNTLFNVYKDNMIIQVGNGFGIKILEGQVNIYRNGLLFKEIGIKSGLDKRVLIVDLVEKSGVSKMKLSKALSVSRTSIDTWVKVYRQKGTEGLVNSSKKAVGRKKVSVVRPEGNKFKEIGQENKEQRLLLEKQKLKIQFPEPELIQGTEKQEHFNQEQSYSENRYAGSFLYWAVVQHQFKFMQAVESIFGHYSTVIYLFVMMHVNRIGSLEQFKTVFKKEFGILLGLPKLLSAPKLWKMIHEAVSLKKSLALRLHFFKYQMQKGLVPHVRDGIYLLMAILYLIQEKKRFTRTSIPKGQ